MNIVIITGASSGIGREFAIQMDAYFDSIDEFWLVARNKAALQQTADGLRHRTRIFAIDVTSSPALEVLEDTIRARNATVRMLISCAGYGLMGAFCEQSLEDELGMIRLNCTALTELTHRVIPYMKKNSRIIQLASSAAFLPQPDFAVYAATKVYVQSFSRALLREVKPLGISVTAVCPGPVDTPFFDIAERGGTTLAIKKYVMAEPEQIVRKALRDAYHKKELSVYGLPIQALRLAAKVLPHGMILELMELMKKKGL